jgi:multidrug transporter EmrE-like cation transporter
VGGASAGAVAATDPASINADCDNGAALHSTHGFRRCATPADRQLVRVIQSAFVLQSALYRSVANVAYPLLVGVGLVRVIVIGTVVATLRYPAVWLCTRDVSLRIAEAVPVRVISGVVVAVDLSLPARHGSLRLSLVSISASPIRASLCIPGGTAAYGGRFYACGQAKRRLG